MHCFREMLLNFRADQISSTLFDVLRRVYSNLLCGFTSDSPASIARPELGIIFSSWPSSFLPAVPFPKAHHIP